MLDLLGDNTMRDTFPSSDVGRGNWDPSYLGGSIDPYIAAPGALDYQIVGSRYDQQGGSGYAAAGARSVHVRIYGTPHNYFGLFGSIDGSVSSALSNAGWQVDRVTDSGLGCTSFGCTLDIFVTVNDGSPDGVVQSNMIRDIASVFAVSQLSILSGAPAYQNSGGVASTVGNAVTDIAKSIGSGLGSGLGISTPIVLLGGAVLLFVWLRK